MVGLATLCHAAPPAPQLQCDLESADGIHLSQDGTAALKWNKVETASSFELDEAIPGNTDEFHNRYTGPDLASVRTGLAEGTHHFRVRSLDANGTPGAWSEPLAVTVEYMPRGRLILLLVLGGAVALSTVAAILHGHFTHRRKPAA